jgi:hypothetical protein
LWDGLWRRRFLTRWWYWVGSGWWDGCGARYSSYHPTSSDVERDTSLSFY